MDIQTTEQCVAFFGPSGSGKTLTMQAMADLFSPRHGYVRFGGRCLLDTQKRVNVPARRRKIGHLLQSYGLFPHLTVRRNLNFAFTGDTAFFFPQCSGPMWKKGFSLLQ